MSERPHSIVVVGRDAALWLTATAVAHALRPLGVSVTAVELQSQLGKASLYATLPAVESLHSRLGIEEADLLRTTRGSFSLGWNIVRGEARAFLLAHGSYGAPIDGRDFFFYWLKARRFGLDVSLENFSPTAMAARHGRILVPDEATEIFGRTDFAYHLPAIAYSAMLKSRAHQLGVTIYQTVRVGVERSGVGGEIRAVIPDSGTLILGDLFVDASGPEALLIGNSLNVRTEDWREYFPFDTILKGSGKSYSSVPAYAELRVAPSSWTALHGSQAAAHVVHSYADDGDSSDAAIAIATQAAGLALTDVSIGQSAPRLRSAAWVANCVAIGGAACLLDPLFDLELHAIQLGIVHLLSLFPTTLDAGPERDEYNRVTRSLFERLRDFQSALYGLGGIGAAVPVSLQQKIDAFQARGTVAPMEDESFSTDQWRALFTGLDLAPESWPPAIDTTPPELMKEGFRRILGFVHDKVLEQSGHDEYLCRIGAA